MPHTQEIAEEQTLYRAYVVDTYGNPGGTFPYAEEIPGGPWIERSYAEEAIRKYFAKNAPASATDYDIGGYIEEFTVKRSFNPKTKNRF